MTNALAPRAPDALARPLRRPGLLDGASALFRGLGFLVRTPGAWPLALVPVAIVGVVMVAVGSAGAVVLLPRITAALSPHSVLLAEAARFLAGVLLLIVGELVGLAVAQPLSAPALERIVRRVEAEVGAPAWPETGFVVGVGRALQSMLVGYTFGLPLLALLALVSFLFPPAAVVTFPLKLVVLALLFAWDLCDYPLSLHGRPVGDRVALVARNAPAMIGLGVGIALFSLIPCALLFVLPVGVAGAARLVRQIERWEEGPAR